MLPRATSTRTQREASAGKVGGRTQEIQRLIGRSLRSVTNLPALGERTVWIDCDVIQADGGTRTASITGAFVALALALETLRERDALRDDPAVGLRRRHQRRHRRRRAAARPAYDDDSRAEVDMNIVKTGDGRFIEVQGTAEAMPFGREALDRAARPRRRRHPPAHREAARHRRTPGEVASRLQPRASQSAVCIVRLKSDALRTLRCTSCRNVRSARNASPRWLTVDFRSPLPPACSRTAGRKRSGRSQTRRSLRLGRDASFDGPARFEEDRGRRCASASAQTNRAGLPAAPSARAARRKSGRTSPGRSSRRRRSAPTRRPARRRARRSPVPNPRRPSARPCARA